MEGVGEVCGHHGGQRQWGRELPGCNGAWSHVHIHACTHTYMHSQNIRSDPNTLIHRLAFGCWSVQPGYMGHISSCREQPLSVWGHEEPGNMLGTPFHHYMLLAVIAVRGAHGSPPSFSHHYYHSYADGAAWYLILCSPWWGKLPVHRDPLEGWGKDWALIPFHQHHYCLCSCGRLAGLFPALYA